MNILDWIRSLGIGASAPPTIYENGGLPYDVARRGMEAMVDQRLAALNTPVARRMAVGSITPLASDEPARQEYLAPPARTAARRPSRGASGYDTEAMQSLVDRLQDAPYYEGQNANIDDETRMRALAWLTRAQGGGR